jgi:hypothetical protein
MRAREVVPRRSLCSGVTQPLHHDVGYSQTGGMYKKGAVTIVS